MLRSKYVFFELAENITGSVPVPAVTFTMPYNTFLFFTVAVQATGNFAPKLTFPGNYALTD